MRQVAIGAALLLAILAIGVHADIKLQQVDRKVQMPH